MEYPAFRKTGNKEWPYELIANWTSPPLVTLKRAMKGRNGDYVFKVNGRIWVVVSVDGKLTVMRDYGTDICSLAPNFKRAKPGCLAHDALRQCAKEDESCPWNRDDSDLGFLEVMRYYRFKLRMIYYKTVSGFIGDLYLKFTN